MGMKDSRIITKKTIILLTTLGIFLAGFMLYLHLNENKTIFYSEKIIQTSNMGEFHILPNEDTICEGWVTVPESKTFGPYDTELGTLEVIETNIDDITAIPLCIEPDDSLGWYAIWKSVGGYHPSKLNGNGNLDIYQVKSGIAECDGTMIGWKLNFEDVTDLIKVEGEPCATRYWRMTVWTECDNTGCIDANNWPTVEGWTVGVNVPAEKIPGKEVYIDISVEWCGCNDEDQQFTVISFNPKSLKIV